MKKISGRSDIDVCRISVEEFKLSMTVDEFSDKRQKLLSERLPNSELIPGAAQIVQRMKEMGIPIALATSGNRIGQILKAKNHQDLYSNFDVIICGDEVKEAKPSPEIFLTAAQKLGNISPENIIVIDDALNGIIAANKANMISILLSKNKYEFEDPLSKPCIQIGSLYDFEFELFDFQK
mgnify:FL=1